MELTDFLDQIMVGETNCDVKTFQKMSGNFTNVVKLHNQTTLMKESQFQTFILKTILNVTSHLIYQHVVAMETYRFYTQQVQQLHSMEVEHKEIPESPYLE
jgi:hypothetical protein